MNHNVNRPMANAKVAADVRSGANDDGYREICLFASAATAVVWAGFPGYGYQGQYVHEPQSWVG